MFPALFLLFCGILLLVLVWRQKRAAGLPSERIIYSDTRSWGRSEKVLFDPELGLAGKPDYLVQHGDQVIPVEVKKSSADKGPYESHIFQLAAYCRLVEKAYGTRPEYGILHYANKTYAVDYTSRLEAALLNLISAIHQQEGHPDIGRSHNQPGRCTACGYRSACEQKLK